MTSRRPAGPTVEFNVHFKTGRRGSKHIRLGRDQTQKSIVEGRIPRVTILMALAIRLDHLVQSGHIKDFAEIARLGHVTRARVSQIMDFNLLAPDLQEALLNLPLVLEGRDPISERGLRPILRIPDWGKQRRMWRAVIAQKN